MKRYLPAILLLTGCGSFYVMGGLKDFQMNGMARAAFDLQCKEADLQVAQIADSQMGVTGCGKQAVYVAVGGKWINNTSSVGPSK
jgi:hypothetical protein